MYTVGLESSSQACSRPVTGRALTHDLGRVTPSRAAFKAWGMRNYYRTTSSIVRGGFCIGQSQVIGVMLPSQIWPMWSKSRQGLLQLPIGRSTLSGQMDG